MRLFNVWGLDKGVYITTLLDLLAAFNSSPSPSLNFHSLNSHHLDAGPSFSLISQEHEQGVGSEAEQPWLEPRPINDVGIVDFLKLQDTTPEKDCWIGPICLHHEKSVGVHFWWSLPTCLLGASIDKWILPEVPRECQDQVRLDTDVFARLFCFYSSQKCWK